ncbi:MAG: biotin-dependent carboxyltransferase family protein [Brumimicrobium sp.]
MVKVLKAGLHSSIQDEGRFGFRNQGIPTSGAMDQHAFHLANYLLDNKKGTPVIEFMLQGPTLYFGVSTYVAITGASFKAKLNGEEIEQFTRVFIPAGSELSFEPPQKGVFGYLSVKEGFEMKKAFKSCSFYPVVADNFLLEKGKELSIKSFDYKEKTHSKVMRHQNKFEDNILKVFPGPDFKLLPRNTQKYLSMGEFKVGKNSNRMGYEIKHTLKIQAEEIITAPVQPGTIQLTPSGKIIALMRDSQTTGGYARIFQLSEESINILSQKRTGEEVMFEIIE